jgi:hypothetical protein
MTVTPVTVTNAAGRHVIVVTRDSGRHCHGDESLSRHGDGPGHCDGHGPVTVQVVTVLVALGRLPVTQ